MPTIRKCTCGSMPQFVEISRGHKEAVLLNGGFPDAFKMVCPKCGYSTAEHGMASDAEDEWNEHAKKGACYGK